MLNPKVVEIGSPPALAFSINDLSAAPAGGKDGAYRIPGPK
jgi:hypothetical protein